MEGLHTLYAGRVRSGIDSRIEDPEGGLGAERREAAEVAHAAFAAPWRLQPVLDRFAARRLDSEGPDGAEGLDLGPSLSPLPVPDGLFEALWAIVEGAGGGRSALEFTQATAALGGQLDPGFLAAQRAVSLQWPGVAEAAARGWPEPFTLEQLAAAPRGSLAGEFHDLIVCNGFDLEVLDRDALSLRDLPPPLDYLNARILQVHDLWHLVGGYRTTGLHEIAISAFQLAQFGHAYSGFVLAVTLTSASADPLRYAVLSGVIASAWRHGRTTPPLLGVDWPALWDQPLDAVREALGVRPFDSPWPADLFERAA
jgi:ubiquinone biosynthesis protein Coq4